MRIIARSTLQSFREKHSDSEQFLKARYHEISREVFRSPTDILVPYPKSSILNNNRIVFRIKGNNYRIVTKVNYDYQILRIRFVGTHAEYNRINANII